MQRVVRARGLTSCSVWGWRVVQAEGMLGIVPAGAVTGAELAGGLVPRGVAVKAQEGKMEVDKPEGAAAEAKKGEYHGGGKGCVCCWGMRMESEEEGRREGGGGLLLGHGVGRSEGRGKGGAAEGSWLPGRHVA